MPPSKSSPAPSRLLIQEHSPWLTRLSAKYGRPRRELAHLLAARGALEVEIAQLIADLADRRAEALLAARAWPPDSDDLLARAIRGCWQRRRDAQYESQAAQASALLAELKESA